MDYITIDTDRYCGAYSGAFFTAWIGDSPWEVDAGDGTCCDFWSSAVPVHGKGSTKQEALYSLLENCDRWIGSFDLVDIGLDAGKSERFLPVHSDAFIAMFPDSGRD